MMKTLEPRGFTLVEMIVSLAIFALVMLVVTSTYFTLIAVDRQARATNEIVSNLSFAIDAMTRGIRTGTSYQCLQPSGPNSTSGNCTCFSYTDNNLVTGGLPTVVTYHLMANKTIGREEGGTSCLDQNATTITDPAITVSSLVFYVRGVGNTDDTEPQVLFTIKGAMQSAAPGSVGSFSTTTFTIEEAATQRLIDI